MSSDGDGITLLMAIEYIVDEGKEMEYDFSWDEKFLDDILPVLQKYLDRGVSDDHA